jgi:hypothetical protein
VQILNEGFVTAPLEAEVIGNRAPWVTVELTVEPLKGVAQELRKLRVTVFQPRVADVTVVFRLRNEIPDFGGKDRIHFLLTCDAEH